MTLAAAMLFQAVLLASASPASPAANNSSASTATVPAKPAPAATSQPVASKADGSAAELVAIATAEPLPAKPMAAPSADPQQQMANIRIPALPPEKHKVASAEVSGSRKKWLLLSLAQSGGAAFDAYSTRQAVGHGAVEDNPLLRPFAHSAGIYGAIQLAPVGLDFLSRRMQGSEHGFVRRMWWVPQSLGTATFIYSGVHNLHVANQR